MAPLRTIQTKKSSVIPSENSLKNMSTRSSTRLSSGILRKENNVKDIGSFPKRKAVSPIKGNTLKRSALGNITNAIETQCVISGKKTVKKVTASTVTKPTIATTAKVSHPAAAAKPTIHAKSMLPPLPKPRPPITSSVVHPPKLSLGGNLRTVASTVAKPTDKMQIASKPVARLVSPSVSKPACPGIFQASKIKVVAKPRCTTTCVASNRRSSGRRSTLDSTDSSLYMSALSEVQENDTSLESQLPSPPLPTPAVNIDEEYVEDPYQCAIYAYDIFEYLKSREGHFKIDDYMEKQPNLSSNIRAIVVDWMVEIQENFELNHETLYLGVKLMDAYLAQIKVQRMSLQLVGATAMLIAAKYDERIPPSIEDFLYICDGAYKHADITKMEINILKVVNFELGFPLSYRFLRRYARCAKVPMPTLTLARYILEFTLMDYATVTLSDSKLGAAALYIAFKMEKKTDWDDTLTYFSGYRVHHFRDVAHTLNNIMHQKPCKSLSTVRNKYSHKIFYEVAKIPLVSNEEL